MQKELAVKQSHFGTFRISRSPEGHALCVWREKLCLIVKDNAQERRVDLKAAVVLDEPQLSEFVHEKIYP